MTMRHTFLRLPHVIDRTGLSKTAIYAGMRAGLFPQSVPIDPLGSSMTVGWIEEEIDAWMEERIRRARGKGEGREERVEVKSNHRRDPRGRGTGEEQGTTAPPRGADGPQR